MPKISLVLGRRTIQVFDLDQPTIRIGRSAEMDITIDNVSVSREHAQIVSGDGGWLVRDAGSSNGTFMGGERIEGDRPLQTGDEISIGKFSLFFDKVVGDAETATTRTASAPVAGASAPGTMFMKPTDIEEIVRTSVEQRRAHLAWNAGKAKGEHVLPERGCVLIGKDDLCDLRVPAGPKHHLLVSRNDDGWSVRNLASWGKMKVDGRAVLRAPLRDGALIEMSGLRMKFVDQIG